MTPTATRAAAILRAWNRGERACEWRCGDARGSDPINVATLGFARGVARAEMKIEAGLLVPIIKESA